MKTEPSIDMFFRKNSNANNHKQNVLINAGKKTEPQITTTLVCKSKLGRNILIDILKGSIFGRIQKNSTLKTPYQLHPGGWIIEPERNLHL